MTINTRLEFDGGAPNNARLQQVLDQIGRAIDNLMLGVGSSPFIIQGAEGVYIEMRNNASVPVAQLRILQSTDVFGGSVGLGINALANASPNTYNVGIGPNALAACTSGAENVAVGEGALHANTTGAANTGVGEEALYTNTTGNFNTAIGLNAMYANTTGVNNTGVGYQSLVGNTTGHDNVAIGYFTWQATVNGIGNCSVGTGCGTFAGTGTVNYNTLVGFQSFPNLGNDSSANIALGAHPTTPISGLTYNNCIIIGYDIDPPVDSANGQMTIGNLIFGTGLAATAKTISTGNIGIATAAPSARLHLPAGTATASTAPLKITTGTLLGTPEDGAVEYDGVHLYITIGASRKTITVS